MSNSPALRSASANPPCDVLENLQGCTRLLTARELAGMLSISPKTIYAYVERNMIPHYKIASNVRFRARDVAEWLRNSMSASPGRRT